MSNADEIQIWFDAVQSYDNGDIDEAIKMFESTKRNAKMLFNIGCCYLKKEDLDRAEKHYHDSLQLDQFLAIAEFMLGLIYLLCEENELSMKHFQNAYNKLRGNRYVDYKQLGFKYKLYACEIMTNQAVAAYKNNEIRKAKKWLLQAVGCKAEKKHEIIEECLSFLQSGYPIHPFTPPQSEIFRPPRDAVKNLKKKDFLGKARVISTVNTEEIYSCFSGVRDRRNEQNLPVTNRKKLMKDLRGVERKSSLRPTPRPPKSIPKNIGRVIDAPLPTLPLRKIILPPSKELPSPPSSHPPVPSVRNSSTSKIHPLISMDNDNPNRPSRKKQLKLPTNETSSPSSSSRPVQTSQSSMKPLPRKSSRVLDTTDKPPSIKPRNSVDIRPPRTVSRQTTKDLSFDISLRSRSPDSTIYNDLQLGPGDGADIYADIDETEIKYKPPRPPPFLPKRNIEETTFNTPSYSSQQNDPKDKSMYQRRYSNGQKPNGAPPPPPTMETVSLQKIPRKSLPRSLSSSLHEQDLNNELSEVLKIQSSSLTTNKSLSKIKQNSTPEKTSEPKNLATYYNVEVQYTFIRRICVEEGTSLEELHQVVQSQCIPNEIEICFTDDLGRQQTLTEKKMNKVLDGDTTKIKKLFCFPDNS